jgi:hypothetical protein
VLWVTVRPVGLAGARRVFLSYAAAGAGGGLFVKASLEIVMFEYMVQASNAKGRWRHVLLSGETAIPVVIEETHEVAGTFCTSLTLKSMYTWRRCPTMSWGAADLYNVGPCISGPAVHCR